MLRSAVIGLGSIAPVHLAAIAGCAGAQLVAGCDVDPARQTVLPQGTRFYTSYTQLLETEKPDVAHICLPHHLHYPAAQACAERGIHVFLEKPPALDAAQARLLCGLEAKHGVHICVCLQNRYNASSQLLASRLQSGECGRVTGLRGAMCWRRDQSYYAAGPWRGVHAQAGGGCMINQALHTLDLLLCFAGAPLNQVNALVGNLLEFGLDVEDTAVARLRFANGVQGLFVATIANFEDADVQIEVACEKAQFCIRDKALYQKTGQGLQKLAQDDQAVPGKACYGNSHERLVGIFYDALAGSGESYPHPQDALAVMEAIDKIQAAGAAPRT